MGKLIASFNPFDPSDPTYQTQEDNLYNMVYNLPEDTKMAGSNFYPSDESPADEANEIGGESDTTNVGGRGPEVISGQEQQFDNEM